MVRVRVIPRREEWGWCGLVRSDVLRPRVSESYVAGSTGILRRDRLEEEGHGKENVEPLETLHPRF